jgi:hypothetical protein
MPMVGRLADVADVADVADDQRPTTEDPPFMRQ